ncbi:hypothetical protein ACFQZ4_46250 [Catellatospora coxensis]
MVVPSSIGKPCRSASSASNSTKPIVVVNALVRVSATTAANAATATAITTSCAVVSSVTTAARMVTAAIAAAPCLQPTPEGVHLTCAYRGQSVISLGSCPGHGREGFGSPGSARC